MLLPGTSIRPFSDSIFIHYKENIVTANGSVSDIASYTIRIVIQSMDRGMDIFDSATRVPSGLP